MISDITTDTLTTALAGLSARERVSSNNISNLETPNFKAGQVSFEDSLKSAIAAGDPSKATISQTSAPGTVSANGNDVSLSDETVTDEKTQMQFQLLSGALTAKFGLLDTVIKGG